MNPGVYFFTQAQRGAFKLYIQDVRRVSYPHKHHERLLISGTYLLEITTFILQLEL